MTKPRLGRGLSVLIPNDLRDNTHASMLQESLKFHNVKVVPIHCIRPNPEQPRMRFDSYALHELAESIKHHGVLTPLLVQKDGLHQYTLIAGERRLRASGLAGLEYVPVIIREQISSKLQLELALVENLQREDLDPIETALAYQRLIDDFQMTQAQVGLRVGKGRATIANIVRLLKLPLFLQEELRAGHISAGHCKSLLSLQDEEQQRAVLKKIYDEDLTVREVESLVKKMSKNLRHKFRYSEKNAATIQHLSKFLQTNVKIDGGHKKGQIIIEYQSLHELQRICKQLMNVE